MNFERLHKALLIPALLLLASCKVEPKPIDYGSDACHFCRMTIVDKQHGAEIVTSKGKVFKFDAVECMLNYMQDLEGPSDALFLANGYTRPAELLNATKATYLVSEGIPSPMGEYLTAFGSDSEAMEAQKKHGGILYSWKDIQKRFNK